MSLNWNIEKVKDHETLMFDEDGVMKTRSHILILCTMFVGMHEISEKNWEEFFTRIKMHEDTFGSLVRKVVDDDVVDDPFTPEHIKAHIGLHTNASTLTKVQFANTITRRLREEAERELSKFKRGNNDDIRPDESN